MALHFKSIAGGDHGFAPHVAAMENVVQKVGELVREPLPFEAGDVPDARVKVDARGMTLQQPHKSFGDGLRLRGRDLNRARQARGDIPQITARRHDK